ncbi:hypothetical protein HAHE_10000 [Haloferula helveola]|uniref:Uncharacterized protein n=1 Tax=Haloferula helveola TaxID=490095 RepID=A0ABM7RJ98_9BACT|nr:hypothetical protein HAHE_10000 [Haloferula helveola]
MSEFNPYQVPEAGGPPSQVTGGLWQVSQGCLLFRDGARLPEIDLYTGRADIPLMPASAEFLVLGSRGAQLLIRMLVMFLVVGAFVYFGPSLEVSLPVLWLVLIVVLMAIRVVRARKALRARLNWHVGSEDEKRRRNITAWGRRGFWLGFGLFAATFVLELREWSTLGLLAFVAGLVALSVTQRRVLQLRCERVRDGWFELRGVPAAALQVLAARQSEEVREWMDRSGETRERKVFKTYLYRFSLRTLLGDQIWNPLALLTMLILKLRRSRLLVRDCFASSEAEDLGSSGWMPSLRAKWDELQGVPDFEGWRLLLARNLGSPIGDLRTQWFTLVSPDERHSLVVGVVTVANLQASKEILETTFRAWTSSGLQIVTSNTLLQRPLPEHYRVRRVRGSLTQVLTSHLARLEGLDLLPAAFPEGWEERMEEEIRERHDLLEAAGYYGPTRTEEVPVRH